MKSKQFLEELRNKSVEELNADLDAAKKELFNLRFQNATNQLDNTAESKRLREILPELRQCSQHELICIVISINMLNAINFERRTRSWREILERLV